MHARLSFAFSSRYAKIQTSNFRKVVQQHTEGMVESIIWILLEIYFCFSSEIILKILAVPNVTAHPSTASVAYRLHIIRSGTINNCLWTLKGLSPIRNLSKSGSRDAQLSVSELDTPLYSALS